MDKFGLRGKRFNVGVAPAIIATLGVSLFALSIGSSSAQAKDMCEAVSFSSPPASPPLIRYGLTGGGEEPLALLWADKESYPNNGRFYSIEATRYRPTDRMAALRAGQLDAGTISFPGLITAVNVGMDARAVAMLVHVNKIDNQGAFVSLSGSGIKTPKDFAGKRVGYYGPNTISEYWVRNAMKAAGANQKDVSFAAMPPPAQEQALRNKQIDVAWLARQFLARAKRKGGVNVLLTPYQATGAEQPSLMIFFSSKFVKANPQAYCAWRADYQSALKSWTTNRKAAFPKLIKAKYIRPVSAKAGPDGGRSPGGLMSLRELNSTMKDMVASGFLRESRVRPATDLVMQGYALTSE